MVRMRNSRTGVVVDVHERRASVMRDVWVRDDDADADSEPAPDAATVDDVLAWVDGDPERALQAREAEEQRPDGPRVTLLQQLDDITG